VWSAGWHGEGVLGGGRRAKKVPRSPPQRGRKEHVIAECRLFLVSAAFLRCPIGLGGAGRLRRGGMRCELPKSLCCTFVAVELDGCPGGRYYVCEEAS